MLEIELPGNRAQFSPGEVISVVSRWNLKQPAERLELRLVWNTVGKGDQNLSVEQTWTYRDDTMNGTVSEEVTLPFAPYSFSGKLLSLIWAFELIAFPGGESTRREIVLAPEAEELSLLTEDAV